MAKRRRIKSDKPRSLWPVVVVVLSIWLASGNVSGCKPPLDWLPDFRPDVVAPEEAISKPAETFGLDVLLPKALAGKSGAKYARFAKSFADLIEADGKRDKPLLLWVSQPFERESIAVVIAESAAIEALATVYAEQVRGNDTGPADADRLSLTAERRAKAVAFWRAAAYGFSLAK